MDNKLFIKMVQTVLDSIMKKENLLVTEKTDK